MEVRVTKCKNGHYYDANKHPICPHCGSASILEGIATEQPEKKKGMQLFKKKKTEVPMCDATKQKDMKMDLVEEVEQHELELEDVVCTDSSQVVMVEDVVTEGMFMEDAYQPIEDEVTEAFFNDDVEDVVCHEEPIQNEIIKPFKSLVEEIEGVKADNNAKTIGFFAMQTKETDEINKVQEPLASIVQEPVAGWLVCIGGKQLGKDFKIVTGRNSVGRNSSNYIHLENEESVSREKHAWIIYEPRKRQFYVQPGESSGLTYVNDDTVLESRQLKHGDILEFGETKFIFIPLCCDNFTWNDYITKE